MGRIMMNEAEAQSLRIQNFQIARWTLALPLQQREEQREEQHVQRDLPTASVTM
jgi:hypothetical protein